MSEDNPIKDIVSTTKVAIDSLVTIVSLQLSPSIKELGEMAGDTIRYFRFKNEVNILVKAQAVVKERVYRPNRISSKIFGTIVKYGSLEDEESMLDKWANLLANAVNPNAIKETKRTYIEILKQLSPKEALILDKFFDYYSAESIRRDHNFQEAISIKGEHLKELSGLEQAQYERCMDNILRLNLLGTGGLRFTPPQPEQKRYTGEKEEIVFTAFGYDFVSICRGD